MTPSLYEHQRRFLIENPSLALLVHGMGSGKTRTSIEWAKKRLPKSVLIVVPKGLKENWRREAVKWGLYKYHIVSKEEFKRDVKDYKHRVLIVDEADHFFSPQFKSVLSKAMRWYMKTNKPEALFLSGTPYRSSAWNIYTAGTLLGHKWDYWKFQSTYFTQIRMGYRTIWQPKKGTEGRLRKLIESISDVFNPEEAFDIPPQVDEVVYVEESRPQMTAHKENIEIVPIVRFTRDHQIEAGVGIPIGYDPKFEVIKEYARTIDKFAIVCRYKEQLKRYGGELRDMGYRVYEMHGEVRDRSGVLDDVEKYDKCILLIQSATCEGYEAPSVGVMVFASMDYSYRNYVQVKARIHRMNRLKKNVYIHLLAGKCDRSIMDAMEKKENFDVVKHYEGEGGNR